VALYFTSSFASLVLTAVSRRGEVEADKVPTGTSTGQRMLA
jgi:hypothetical protein